MMYQEMKQIVEKTSVPTKNQLCAEELIELIERGRKNPEELFDVISTVYAYGYHVGKHDTTKKK